LSHVLGVFSKKSFPILHDNGFGGSAFDLLSAVGSRAVSFKKGRTNKRLRKELKRRPQRIGNHARRSRGHCCHNVSVERNCVLPKLEFPDEEFLMKDHITNIVCRISCVSPSAAMSLSSFAFDVCPLLSACHGHAGFRKRDIAPKNLGAQGFPTRRLFELKIIERSDVISALYAPY